MTTAGIVFTALLGAAAITAWRAGDYALAFVCLLFALCAAAAVLTAG